MKLQVRRVITSTSGRESLVAYNRSTNTEVSMPVTSAQAEQAREILRRREQLTRPVVEVTLLFDEEPSE